MGISRELAESLVSEARPDLPVRGGSWKAGRKVGEFRVPVVSRAPLGPEVSWRYFSPERVDIRHGPESFRRQLFELDPRLDVVWHPVNERWVVWFRSTQGWRVLFPVQYWPNGEYMPLDERTIAKCWDRCGRRWGNGKAYWDRIESEITRSIRAKEEARRQEARDIAGDVYDSAQISVSMCGPSNGSKFADHQSE